MSLKYLPLETSTSILSDLQIEAILTIIVAFAILLFLPAFPFTASFLTPREKAIAQARLNRDQKPRSHGGMSGWTGFKAIISDPTSWMFMIVYASCESQGF
jgi:hypothetical protein